MANRYPLIVDTADSNKIKELPSGDNLNLSGSGIINAASVSVTGTITTSAITVNGQSLADVATSGSYNDLLNKPNIITSYNDLTNKPTIPSLISQLGDVSATAPEVGDGLIWNGIEYTPGTINATVDLSTSNLSELQNVITVGDTSNKFLKYYSGAWRAANVTWTDVQSRPTALSQLINDVGFISADDPALTLGSIAPLSTTTVQGDNIILDGRLTSTGTGFYLTHTGESGIQFGSTLEINSNGMGGIVFCGGGANIDRFDFASAESIKLPTYTDTTARDAAIIEAYADGGQMVYLADTGPSGSPSGVAGVQIYDGTAGQWRTLSWT